MTPTGCSAGAGSKVFCNPIVISPPAQQKDATLPDQLFEQIGEQFSGDFPNGAVGVSVQS